MDFLQSHPDISYPIFQIVCSTYKRAFNDSHANRKFQLDSKDLKNICLVSKSCNALATPLLYRSVTLFQNDKETDLAEPTDPQETKCRLYLLDDRNILARSWVRDIIVRSAYLPSNSTQATAKLEKFEDELSTLLESCRIFKISSRTSLPSDLLEITIGHFIQLARPDTVFTRCDGKPHS